MDRKGILICAVLMGLIGDTLGTPINGSTHAYEIIDFSAAMTTLQTTNLTEITWAHAVNSQKELEDALNRDIDMIEADIVLGKINGSGPDIPVMGHPPAVTSDISLDTFLRTILSFNNKSHKKKGAKLDFKSIEVFEGSLAILHELWAMMRYPIWLNADIVKGPVHQNDTIPVDPDRFFAACKHFTEAVLSIGWTTRWGNHFTEGCYTDSEIAEMVDVIKKNHITESKQPITFPVRAGIAANSEKQLHNLINAVNDTNESSLTIWSSPNDHVNIKKLRSLIFSFGLDRVYLDVPEEVSRELQLNKGPDNSAGLSSFKNFSLVSLCLLVATFAVQE